MALALVTGASRGFGLALTDVLVRDGFEVIVDARDADRLHAAVATTVHPEAVHPLPGDVTDPAHRDALAGAVDRLGPLDLLVNNASALGPSPLPRLADLPAGALTEVLTANVLAPLALTRRLLGSLETAAGVVVNVSSDAAVEAYPGWGAYGASKAALDQLSAVLAVEHPTLRVYAFDPGDMRTDMHQAAYPGEDISDRPDPREVAPRLLELLRQRPPSGRYRAADDLAATGIVA